MSPRLVLAGLALSSSSALLACAITSTGCGGSGGGGGGGGGGGFGAIPIGLSLSPATGQTAGGTTVVARSSTSGVAFDPSFPVTVSVGGVPSPNARVMSPAEVWFDTPAAPGGNKSAAAQVDLRHGPFAGSATFAYTAIAHTLGVVSPSNGPTGGGYTATITGSGFTSGMTVRFGQTLAAVLSTTPMQLQVSVPAGQAGTVDVVVVHPDGFQVTLPAAFRWDASAPPPPPPPPGPAAPTGLQATLVQSDRVELAWMDVATNELGYRLMRRAPGGTFTQIGGDRPSGTTSATDASVSASTAYEYQVVAFDAAGSSGSNVLAVTTPTPPPTQFVFWNQVIPLTGDGMILAIDRSATMSLSLTGSFLDQDDNLAGGNRYDAARAEAIRTIRALPPSLLFNVVLWDQCQEALWPARRPATPANKQLAIDWLIASPVPQGWTNTSGGVFGSLLEPANRTVVLVSDGPPNFLDCGMSIVGTAQEHLAAIAAINTQSAAIHAAGLATAGDATTRQFLIDITTQHNGVFWEPSLGGNGPAAPTNLTPTPLGPTSVQLTWTDVATTEDGYKVFRRIAGSGLTTIPQVGNDLAANSVAFTDTTVQPATTYDYFLVAFTGSALSVVVETQVTTPP